MTPEQKQHYNRLLESLSNQKYNEFYSFVRTTLTVTATVFGVFISFAKPELNNVCEIALFKTAIVSLALCILAGVILLFASHFHISLQEKAVREAKRLCILGEELNVKNPWFFFNSETCFLFNFSIIFLIFIMLLFVYQLKLNNDTVTNANKQLLGCIFLKLRLLL